MSDFFNDARNRVTIRQIFNDQDFDPNTLTTVQNPWQAPDDALKDKKLRAEALKNAGLVLLAPCPFPDNTDIYAENAFPQQWIDDNADILDEHAELLLPAGEFEYIPKYYQKSSLNGYDLKACEQCVYQEIVESIPPDDCTSPLMYQQMEEYCFGNGTYSGQVKRLEGMANIHYGRNGKFKAKTLEENGHNFESLSNLLDYFMPVIPDPDAPTLSHLPRWYINGARDRDRLPSFSPQSSSGAPYIGKTKGEVYIESLALLDDGFQQLNDAIKSGKEELLRQFFETNPFFFMAPVCRKYEAYKKLLWETKTRGIWMANDSMVMGLGLAADPVVKNVQNCIQIRNGSLYKFSPFHGGMHLFIQRLLREDEPQVYIYADNLFFCIPYTVELITENATVTRLQWTSIDLEKGESNATREYVQAFCYHLLSKGWVDEHGMPKFSYTWAYYLMNIIPLTAVEAVAIIGNLQFTYPALGSGFKKTYEINEIMSVILQCEWYKQGCPLITKESLHKICEACGVNARIEKQFDDLQGEFDKARREPLKMRDTEKYFAPNKANWQLQDKAFRRQMTKDFTDPEETFDKMNEGYKWKYTPKMKPYEVKLDLLGFSAVYSENLDQFIPILASDRLCRSIALPNISESKFKDDFNGAAAYSFIRYNAAMFMGGCCLPGFGHTMEFLINEKHKYISKVVDPKKVSDILTRMEKLFPEASVLKSEIYQAQSFLLKPWNPSAFYNLHELRNADKAVDKLMEGPSYSEQMKRLDLDVLEKADKRFVSDTVAKVVCDTLTRTKITKLKNELDDIPRPMTKEQYFGRRKEIIKSIDSNERKGFEECLKIFGTLFRPDEKAANLMPRAEATAEQAHNPVAELNLPKRPTKGTTNSLLYGQTTIRDYKKKKNQTVRKVQRTRADGIPVVHVLHDERQGTKKARENRKKQDQKKRSAARKAELEQHE